MAPARVWLSERLCAMGARWRHAMNTRTILSVVAILSRAITTPGIAQAVIQVPGAHAFYRPNAHLGIASAPTQRREAVVVGRGTAEAMALPPSFRPSTPGKETTTRPWTAPVGHRQPRADDVPTPTTPSQQSLDQEDANVDRIVSNVCRGC
jgi:hypothetical protein